MKLLQLMMLFISPMAFSELDLVELEPAKLLIEKYSKFDLSKNLDVQHVSWLCNIYYSKHSQLSGAAGKASFIGGVWRCPLRSGFGGNNTNEYIYVNRDTILVSRNGWPSENGQELLAFAMEKLKQKVAASAANKSVN